MARQKEVSSRAAGKEVVTNHSESFSLVGSGIARNKKVKKGKETGLMLAGSMKSFTIFFIGYAIRKNYGQQSRGGLRSSTFSEESGATSW